MSAVLQESGVRLERKSTDLLQHARVRLLGDRLLVKPLAWEPSRILSTVLDAKPLRGVVIAVGPGYRQKKWKYNSRGERIGYQETGRIIPTEVKPGDVIEVGGLELRGYDFPQVLVGTELHFICQEQDVCGVVEPSEAGHASAAAS